MARELSSILSELNNVYNPQRDIIKQQQSSIDPAMEAENKGLMAAKQDAFSQITDQSNRRGLFYSGIPIAEEQRYTGATYLPAVANLRSKYAQQRFNLQDSLNNIDLEQRKYGQGIYEGELARDEQQRQFDAQMRAQQEAADRASRAASAGSGWSPDLSGGNNTAGVQGARSRVPSLRQQLQTQAKAGDWNSQVLLNYVGDDGRYDGPVNSQAEFDILRKMGATGNYYVPKNGSSGGPSVSSAVRAGVKIAGGASGNPLLRAISGIF